MKFLCDRCKTRYSIGDDRVRGKILKIRCKNCANVITVREGMVADVDAVPPPEYAGRTKQATTLSPQAHEEAVTVPRSVAVKAKDPAGRAQEPAPARPTATTGSGAQKPVRSGLGDAASDPARRAAQPGLKPEPINALNAAFASAMAKPPPVLEEEWYVSIDGVQAGPFSLAEAQGWVTHKPFDAELHCWSEGFDDWLPVDKVSHFRGLRKRPVQAPPPLPRVAGSPRAAAAAPAAARASAPDEGRPLFAATMATLERGAAPASSAGLQLPSAAALATPAARATPAQGVALHGAPSNGLNGASSTLPTKPERLLARPGTNPKAKLDAVPATPATEPSGPVASGPPQRGIHLFDSNDAAESKTQLRAAPSADPFVQPARPEPRPVAMPGPGLPQATLHGTGPNAAITTAAVSDAVSQLDSDGDHELHIGEVSRVVNLADLARPPRTSAAPARRVGIATGAAARLPADASRLSPEVIGAQRATNSAPALGTAGEGAQGPSADAELNPPAVKSHRRGLVALLGVATILVLGVAAAVVLFVTDGDDPSADHLGRVHDIDTSRPEDPITHRPLPPGTPVPTPPTNPFIPRPHPRPPTVGSNQPPDPPPGNSLRGEEIEDMARKHQDMTQRCYMRSQRGADSILVGDVKKITVTLTIDKDGVVNDVGLSDHAADNLGKCLISSMKTWKFRASAGGAFRISLNFVSG